MGYSLCPLSLGERARVRGLKAKNSPLIIGLTIIPIFRS
jgi:hypothetical protein